MTAIPRIGTALLALTLMSASASAQWFSAGLRGTGSVPTGSFAQDQSSTNTALIEGAKNGFGYGLDVGAGIGMIGAYAGFDRIKFNCETTTCRSDGEYTLQGVTVGAKLTPPMLSAFHPFVKAGVTFQNLKGGYGGSSSNRLETDQEPGFEIGAGGDIRFMGLLSLTPQVRYVGQKLKARVPGVTTTTSTTASQAVNYFSFDLGLSLRTPFGGMD